MYLSIFNSFRFIRCLSQCVSPKIAIFSPGDAPGAITLNFVWMEREFDAYKLSRCMCQVLPFLRYSEIFVKKSAFYHTPLHSFPLEYRHPLWLGKTRMVSLYPMVKKFRRYVYSFRRDPRTWQTDGRTDRRTLHDSIVRACTASRGKNNRFEYFSDFW